MVSRGRQFSINLVDTMTVAQLRKCLSIYERDYTKIMVGDRDLLEYAANQQHLAEFPIS